MNRLIFVLPLLSGVHCALSQGETFKNENEHVFEQPRENDLIPVISEELRTRESSDSSNDEGVDDVDLKTTSDLQNWYGETATDISTGRQRVVSELKNHWQR